MYLCIFLVFWNGGKNDGILVAAGGLGRGDVGFVGNAGGVVFNRGRFGHDDLAGFGRDGGKLTEIGVIKKITGSTDAGGNAAGIDTDGIETKAVGSSRGPDSGNGFGAGGADVAGGVGNGDAVGLGKRVVFLGHYLIAVAGGGGNSNSIGGSGGNAGNEGAEVNGEIVDGKGKLVKSIVNIFEAGFEDKVSGGVGTGSILAKIVGQGVVGGVFLAGGHIEIAPVDVVVGGRKMLGKYRNGGKHE